MKKNKIYQNGFSLSEVVIVIAVIAILGLITNSFLIDLFKSSKQITDKVTDEIDNNLASFILQKELNNSYIIRNGQISCPDNTEIENILKTDSSTTSVPDFELTSDGKFTFPFVEYAGNVARTDTISTSMEVSVTSSKMFPTGSIVLISNSVHSKKTWFGKVSGSTSEGKLTLENVSTNPLNCTMTSSSDSLENVFKAEQGSSEDEKESSTAMIFRISFATYQQKENDIKKSLWPTDGEKANEPQRIFYSGVKSFKITSANWKSYYDTNAYNAFNTTTTTTTNTNINKSSIESGRWNAKVEIETFINGSQKNEVHKTSLKVHYELNLSKHMNIETALSSSAKDNVTVTYPSCYVIAERAEGFILSKNLKNIYEKDANGKDTETLKYNLDKLKHGLAYVFRGAAFTTESSKKNDFYTPTIQVTLIEKKSSEGDCSDASDTEKEDTESDCATKKKTAKKKKKKKKTGTTPTDYEDTDPQAAYCYSTQKILPSDSTSSNSADPTSIKSTSTFSLTPYLNGDMKEYICIIWESVKVQSIMSYTTENSSETVSCSNFEIDIPSEYKFSSTEPSCLQDGSIDFGSPLVDTETQVVGPPLWLDKKSCCWQSSCTDDDYTSCNENTGEDLYKVRFKNYYDAAKQKYYYEVDCS